MGKTSLWPKLLPPLGIVLAVVLLAAAAVLWFDGSRASGPGEAAVGRLVAVAQAARADARTALTGDMQVFERLAASTAGLGGQRAALAGDSAAAPAVRRLAEHSAWDAFDGALAEIAQARDALAAVRAARAELLEVAPQLLAATATLASTLTKADLEANQRFLERFELAVEGIQQNARALGAAAAEESAQRLTDGEQQLFEIVRGLSGEDAALGITPIQGEAARQRLGEVTEWLERARTAIGTMGSSADRLAAAAAAGDRLDAAAGQLLAEYRGGPSVQSGSAGGPLLAFALVGVAVVLVILMMFIYYRARDFRRAAEIQAAQNERNQQAILRLLDELSNLADGDLTVQATVTEDITGAIADSINYAIEALRELVATVNDSAILVDAAAKQTEASSRQLVRASETQAKQSAAASESMARMAASIEEVSGNAERASDVARHAVAVAHKGGEAVRRTIAGMNTIRETIQDTSKRIKRLGESSQEIGNIVELIEEIAEQTNILALNASIEASRAGEASRGFAVVADEVQKLAERSTNATKKIEVLVSTIQSDTNEAVVSMERSTTDVVGGALLAENAGAALDEIEQVSHQIASLVQNISSSSKEQTGVAGAITKNMQVLREISAKATESTTATSGAISKLSELASQLRRTVAGFTLPDQGTGTGVLSQARVAAALQRAEAAREEPLAEMTERRRQSG